MLTYRDETDRNVIGVIEKALLSPNSPIVFDLKIEGQEIKNGKFVIGPWAGPQADVSNLIHEAAHFAEREVDKLLLFPHSSWGFSYGKYWEIGIQSGWEPQTDQSVRREQRVWAYQLATLRHFGLDPDPYDLLESAVYLPAWCFYQPFAEDDYKSEARIQRLADDANIMSKNEYNWEAFISNWNLRVERLRNVTGIEGDIAN